MSIEALRKFRRQLRDRRGVCINGQIDDYRFIGHAGTSLGTRNALSLALCEPVMP
ncbi:hypothetical protein ACVOMV_15930 [Mesorhizobium atlanticum]